MQRLKFLTTIQRTALIAATVMLTAAWSTGCGDSSGDDDDNDDDDSASVDAGGDTGADAGPPAPPDAGLPAGPPERVWVVPWEADICPGQRLQLKASAFYGEDLYEITNIATWTSSNEDVATVNATGEMLGVATGTVVIKAELLGVSDAADVGVVNDEVAGLIIQPSSASVAAGLGQTFAAKSVTTCGVATDVTAIAEWGSTVPSVASVVEPGEVQTALQGTATITASAGGYDATAAITVTRALPETLAVSPSAVELEPATCDPPPVQLTANVTFTDGSVEEVTDTAMWTSGAPAIVEVTGPGLIVGITTGGTEVIASYAADGVTVTGLTGATVMGACAAP